MPQAPTAVLGKSATREFPRAFGILALLKPLGRNDRGEVYVALRPEGVDRLCVVNLLAPAVVEQPGVTDALRAQAGWLVARVHGNLVQTYDVGQVAERLFLLNEYVEGRDLAMLLKAAVRRAGGLPLEAAVYVAVEVSAALGFLRSTEERVTGIPLSLVGLSASAVIASREGTIKLVHHGSGLAPSPDSLVDRDAARVSLIAPEHAKNGGGSPRGDVYAVGALLWQMLTGRPLGGDNGRAHLDALRSGKFNAPKVSSVLPAERPIPAGLDDLVAAALARPEARPASCEAMRAHLVSVVKGVAGAGAAALRHQITELFSPSMAAESGELARLTEQADKELMRPGTRRPAATLTNFDPVARSRKEAAANAESDLALGKVIPGTRYRVLEKLGEGGMGAVYAAEHVDIERKVALKLVHAELLRNPLVLGQFRQEARAASRIGNPYICDVTDWGELPDGRVFFVMEYLDGLSLGKVLDQKRKLPAARCIPVLRQVAKALGSAHEKGIVHLDVKPDNVILLSKDGRSDAVKVVDFGVAGILGQSGGVAKVMGTPEYMAPERATGKSYDHRSDIYSLGVMAYEMLVGEVPFQGSTPIETLAMQASDAPDLINERLTTPVPGAIEAVVMRMLEKSPDRRPQSMAEVEILLLEAQMESRIRTPWDDLALPVVPPERAARIARWLQSSALRIRTFAAAAAAAAVVGAGTSAYFAFREPPGGLREPAAAAAAAQAPIPLPPPQMQGSSGGLGAPPTQPMGGPIGMATSEPLAPSLIDPPGGAGVPGGTYVPPGMGGLPPSSAGRSPSVSGYVPSSPSRGHDSSPGARRVRRGEEVPPPTAADGNGEPASASDAAGARRAAQRGMVALEDGSIEQARREFELALSIDRRNVTAMGGMAEVAFERGRMEEVVHFAAKASRFSPKTLKYWILLGDASQRLGRIPEALASYQRALALAPGDPSITNRIAQARSRTGPSR